MSNITATAPRPQFADRHCGLSADDERAMLKVIGLKTLEDVAGILPPEISCAAPDVCAPMTEDGATELLSDMVTNNKKGASLIGLGYYSTSMPAVVRRNLLESAAWYTAYTPYQPEISQGRLEMLLNFQTMIADLTALPLAGASLLDEATAAAEAMTLLRRCGKNKSAVFLVDESLFPQTLAVLRTRARPLEIDLKIISTESFTDHPDAFGALFAYPGGDGRIYDPAPIVAKLKTSGVISACCTDLLALTLLRPPGEIGFEVAVGSAQRFGVPMGCGGPHPAFMAFTDELRRHVPGRIVGVSKDSKGRAGYRLALQTREQHIRREKATSNICTAQALPAMLAAAYAVYLGPKRLREIAERTHLLARVLVAGLQKMGRTPTHNTFFDTIRIHAEDAPAIAAMALNERVCLLHLPDIIGISTDECTTSSNIQAIWRAFGNNAPSFAEVLAEVNTENKDESLPDSLQRKSEFCTHPVFNTYHTEHEMLRYLRRLGQKDIALDRSMIPLGSCTMKLNAAAQMEPLSWPSLANVHPFAPAAYIEGYRRLAADLENLLARVSGFDAVSLQPNAGAQGEYAGLLAIRGYLNSIGQSARDVCLIPKSAHGTNPASAVMAGMRVVPVEIDKQGQVSPEDLTKKIEAHKDNLAALMITYPSTCGVFGRGMPDLCKMVHDVGGQVYMDGANFNALVGVCLPGKMGPDVMHINLHKTFCIPHGGGGPGMGPIGVNAHLRPFLPAHPMQNAPAKEYDTVSAAPWGSALILHISWMYIRMMGDAGLRRATLTALLAANYITKRLNEVYPVEFLDDNGRVAHECIVDTHCFKDAGISVEDIAKRLMDYGFHAPTVSWPVPGAMMIEPTESETKEEIDRFCDSLLAIAGEIDKVRKGEWPRDDNPLINAPHPAEDLIRGEWNHAYTREEAAYPAPWVFAHKYWPPISRIDAAWGDRNLSCACPPLESYL